MNIRTLYYSDTLRKYTVMIDQSGKIEDTSMNTGLGMSSESGKNGIESSVHIRKSHKKRLKPIAKSSLGDEKKYQYKLFACGIFLLTQDYLEEIDQIILDQEYEGKGHLIKNYLWDFYLNNLDIDQENFPELVVDQIHKDGKENPKCHNLAYEARELSIKPTYTSNFRFLKGMILTGPGNGRNTQ